MCIAILNRAGTLPRMTLARASVSNPDGAGMMYSKKGKLVIMKSLNNQHVIDHYLKFRKTDAITPVILHFRISTDGGITTDNCHPYYVNDEVAMVHNGILSEYSGKKTKMSDTRLFIADILSCIPTADLFTDYMSKLIGQAIGYSKFIFLRNDGIYMIVNEFDGEWDKEKTNWFSNDSYKPFDSKSYYKKYYSDNYYYDDWWEGKVPPQNKGKGKSYTPKPYVPKSKSSNGNLAIQPMSKKQAKSNLSIAPSYCILCGNPLYGNTQKDRGYCNPCYDWAVVQGTDL